MAPARERRQRDPHAGYRAYVTERGRLGIPSHSAALAVACPWCRASCGEPCRNLATGGRMRPHDARHHVRAAS
jgi:hypothetical protein